MYPEVKEKVYNSSFVRHCSQRRYDDATEILRNATLTSFQLVFDCTCLELRLKAACLTGSPEMKKSIKQKTTTTHSDRPRYIEKVPTRKGHFMLCL